MTEQQKLDLMEDLEILERYEMRLRFEGNKTEAERVLAQRLNMRADAIAKLNKLPTETW